MVHFVADLHFLLLSGMGFLLLRIHGIHGFQVEVQYVYRGSCVCHHTCDLIYVNPPKNQ